MIRKHGALIIDHPVQGVINVPFQEIHLSRKGTIGHPVHLVPFQFIIYHLFFSLKSFHIHISYIIHEGCSD